MKKPFNKWPRFLSSIFALAAFLVCMLTFNEATDTPAGCILWVAVVGAVTLVSGYIGLEFELLLHRKKFKAIGRKGIVYGLIASLLFGAVVGAVGQTLYSLEMQEYTEEEVTDGEETSKTNVALMLDNSASMDSIIPDYIAATEELIDSLNQNVSLQFAIFSDILIDENKHATDMLPMTDTNKTVVKDFMSDSAGGTGYGTNFDIPIDFSVDSLKKNADKDSRSVIVLLTDCQGYVAQETINNYQNSDCELYVLTLGYSASSANQLKSIADKYFELDIENDGSINVSDAVDALQEAVKGDATTETITKKKLSLSENLIGGIGKVNVMRAVIMIIFFGLFTAAAGYVYYGFEDVKKLLLNFAFGAASGILALITPLLGIIPLIILGLGDFNNYTVSENQNNV